jgi:putative ABC transport system permease protein
MSIDLILSGLSQGLVLAIIAYAVMVPFRLLDFADLTAEGAYPFGGAVCAVCLSASMHPLLAICLGILFGGMMGIATSLVYLKFGVNSMLCGIILSAMAYSVNLRIIGKPNISLFNCDGVFSENVLANILILAMVVLALIALLSVFLKTDFGLRLRAVGLNCSFAQRQGICIAGYTMLGLAVAGGLSGLAGCLMVQMQSYMDVGMGIGILIHGLASLMIGESIIGNSTIYRQLLAPLVGAMLYQQIQGVALSVGLAPSDLKFFTGAIVLAVIALQKRLRRNDAVDPL